MAARVLNLDELASRIAIHLLAISPRSTVFLALACKALEVPALRAFWEKKGTLSSLFKYVVPTDIERYIFPLNTDLIVRVSPHFLI